MNTRVRLLRWCRSPRSRHALSVSADQLVFDTDERDPADDLRLHLETIQHLDADEKAVVRTLIESMLLRHEARRFAPAS